MFLFGEGIFEIFFGLGIFENRGEKISASHFRPEGILKPRPSASALNKNLGFASVTPAEGSPLWRGDF